MAALHNHSRAIMLSALCLMVFLVYTSNSCNAAMVNTKAVKGSMKDRTMDQPTQAMDASVRVEVMGFQDTSSATLEDRLKDLLARADGEVADVSPAVVEVSPTAVEVSPVVVEVSPEAAPSSQEVETTPATAAADNSTTGGGELGDGDYYGYDDDNYHEDDSLDQGYDNYGDSNTDGKETGSTNTSDNSSNKAGGTPVIVAASVVVVLIVLVAVAVVTRRRRAAAQQQENGMEFEHGNDSEPTRVRIGGTH
mmetsp:Transcript_12324/g.21050  ORF Transcript_12324/g.21050 Transcript_12324/m.21050 type:complete len:251 (-) Transcript_12324:632-1384(-)